jgi:hypothetical protein
LHGISLHNFLLSASTARALGKDKAHVPKSENDEMKRAIFKAIIGPVPHTDLERSGIYRKDVYRHSGTNFFNRRHEEAL